MVFYLNIPGTASQSVHDALLAALRPASCLVVTTPIELSHMPDRELASYPLIVSNVGFRLLRRLAGPTQTICFLQHPVSRTIAHYRLLREAEQAHASPRDNLFPLRGRTLEQMLQEEHDGAAEQFFHNPQTYLLHSDAWFSSRQAVSNVPSKDILEQAMRNLDQFDFVGFSEESDRDIQRMGRHFGWEIPSASPPTTQTLDAEAGVSPELAERIAEHNQLDLALYHHARARFGRTEAVSAKRGGDHA